MFIRKPLTLLIAVLLVAGILCIVPPMVSVRFRGAVTPLLLSPLQFLYRFYLTSGLLVRAPALYQELRALRQEVAALRIHATRAAEHAAENERLRELLGLQEQAYFPVTVAEVIGKDPSNWLSTVIINKGTRDGIALNQPVMQAGGIVGKITEVHDRHAKVLLISDANSRVIARVQRSRVEGILEGIGGGLCRLKFLPPDADVVLGDTIVTAGIGGVYPGGILIGTVESVRAERGGAYTNCIVKPIARLTMLEEVACLKFDSDLSGSGY